jgi:hypothetical protein
MQVVYPAPTSIKDQIGRYKLPGTAPFKQQTTLPDRDSGKHSVPWRWRVTNPLPVGLVRGANSNLRDA